MASGNTTATLQKNPWLWKHHHLWSAHISLVVASGTTAACVSPIAFRLYGMGRKQTLPKSGWLFLVSVLNQPSLPSLTVINRWWHDYCLYSGSCRLSSFSRQNILPHENSTDILAAKTSTFAAVCPAVSSVPSCCFKAGLASATQQFCPDLLARGVGSDWSRDHGCWTSNGGCAKIGEPRRISVGLGEESW